MKLKTADQLLDTEIERECPMDDKQTAYASDISPDEYDPDADARVAYFHVVHGRSVSLVFQCPLWLVDSMDQSEDRIMKNFSKTGEETF